MGRPKKADLRCNLCDKAFLKKSHLEDHLPCNSRKHQKAGLQCSICNKAFLKRLDFEKHMHDHSSIKSGQVKTYSSWCHICQKKVKDSDYKSHLQMEHQCDFENESTEDSNKDIFSYENGYVLLSKKKIKREVDENRSLKSERFAREKMSNFEDEDFNVFNTKIKIEPLEICDEVEYEEPSKTVSKSKVAYHKCHVCGMRCKGKKGLKIHFAMTHTLKGKTSLDTSQKENQNKFKDHDQQSKELKINSTQVEQNLVSSVQNVNNFSLPDNNCIINLNSVNQSGLLYGTFPINNALSIGNQLNVPGLLNSVDQNARTVEDIPKFDCSSEDYIKWLKKFIYKCKTHKYPLSSTICENIIHVLDEISNAVGNPVGDLRKKSNHFYFMKMHKILSEIIMGHMKHSLSVVVK